MKLETIKKAVASLPHVKTVWVEGNNIYIHEKKGAEKIELEAISAQPTETVEETKSTNKKK